jgi:hypothetical protein
MFTELISNIGPSLLCYHVQAWSHILHGHLGQTGVNPTWIKKENVNMNVNVYFECDIAVPNHTKSRVVYAVGARIIELVLPTQSKRGSWESLRHSALG